MKAEEWIGWGQYIGCEHFLLSKLVWLGLFQGFVGCLVILVVLGGRGAVLLMVQDEVQPQWEVQSGLL